MKNLFILLLFFFVGIPVFAQIPDGYYDAANGLSGVALKNALNNIIDDHNELSYNALRDYVLKESDEDPSNTNNVILLYTGRSQSKSSFGGGANDWNREHVWAKSHGDFGNDPPAGTDAHHIRPTDASVNSDRGNKDFDEGGMQHNEATACYYTSTTWEPRDAVKGDVARMMFYMATRYEGENGEPDLELVNEVGTSGPEFGNLATLLIWHLQDPVDEFEQNRNEVVYSYQNNRNPFVDHPEYVDLIWGEAVYPPEFTSEPVTSASVGQDYSYLVTASDPNAAAELVFGFENGPAWCSLENNNDWTASLSGTPTSEDVGVYFVTISVTNGSSGAVYQSYTLIVTASNAEELKGNVPSVKIFPQPSAHWAIMEIHGIESINGCLDLFNINGVRVRTYHLRQEKYLLDKISINLMLENIPAGIYFYKFEQDDFHLTGKLIQK